MGNRIEEEAELRHYLLGELGEQERWAVEERLFLDGEYLLQLQALEDELLDAYVYGDLTPDERGRVERELLSRPGRRADVRFAHALKDYLDAGAGEAAHTAAAASNVAPRPPRNKPYTFLPPFFRRPPVAALSLAAALFVLAAVVWQVSQSWRRGQGDPLAQAPAPGQVAPAGRGAPQQSSDGQRASTGGGVEGQTGERPDPPQATGVEPEKRGAEQRPQKGPRQHAPAPRPAERGPSLAVTVLLLPASAARGEGQGEVVRVSPEVGTVNLQLPLLGDEGGYGSYRATLRAGGKVVRSWANLRPAAAPSESFVQVPVPARLLRSRNYEITLAGVAGNGRAETVRTYPFQVQAE